jgi:hypothetical protein
MTKSSNIPAPVAVALSAAQGRTARRLLALTAALLVGSTAHALAQAPDPAADHVWGGCVLSTGEGGTVGSLLADIADSDSADEDPDLDQENLQVGFVVVYTLGNPNDGQPIDGGGFTGPVICLNPNLVDVTAFEDDGETPLTETSAIPDDTGPDGADSVDLLAAEEVFILQYEINDDDEESFIDGNIEKRICHTVAGNSDCFIVSPAPTD